MRTKTIEIYKEDILEALAYEPLNIEMKESYFFSNEEEDYCDWGSPLSACSPCAVGSILRRSCPGLSREHGTRLAYGIADVCTDHGLVGLDPEIDPLDSISALSIFYESFRGTGTPVEEVRRHCIDFVEEHFPEDEVICELPVGEEVGYAE